MILPNKGSLSAVNAAIQVIFILSLCFLSLGQEMPVCDTNHRSEGCDANGCDLYLLDTGDGYRLYAGKDYSPGDSVGIPEMIFPMYDVNTNSWSPWHELARPMQLLEGIRFESNFRTFLIATGLPNFLTCAARHTIEPSWTQLHRDTTE